MSKGIIITRPHHDYATQYLTDASKRILEEAEQRNIPVKELRGEKANKNDTTQCIKKLSHKLIIFNGHGTEDTIYGHDNEPLITADINDTILKRKITCARACSTGHTLGQHFNNEQEGCFIGYTQPFMFYIEANRQSTPHKDTIAPLFLQPSNEIPRMLIKGHTAKQAHEKGRQQTLKNIQRVLKRGGKESYSYAEKLWNNYEGQILAGNENATIND